MLSDIQFETKEIKYRRQSFAVRGLGLDGVSKLLAQGSRAQIDGLIQDIAKANEGTKAGDTAAFEVALAGLATKVPELVATLIAFCADEPESADVVAKLPLPVQTEALLAIFELTFDGEESLKNFVSGLKTLIQSMVKAVSTAGQIAKTGTKS